MESVVDNKALFYEFLDSYFTSEYGCKYGTLISKFEKEGKLELVPGDIQFNNKNEQWCGTLNLKINESKMKLEDIINDLIHYPDEMHYENGVLRLWWD